MTVVGRTIRLTATEFELLRVLSAAEGRIVTAESLLRQVWGRRGSDGTDRLRTALKKLREARQRRRQPDLHLHRTRRRIPRRQAGPKGVSGRVGENIRPLLQD